MLTERSRRIVDEGPEVEIGPGARYFQTDDDIGYELAVEVGLNAQFGTVKAMVVARDEETRRLSRQP